MIGLSLEICLSFLEDLVSKVAQKNVLQSSFAHTRARDWILRNRRFTTERKMVTENVIFRLSPPLRFFDSIMIAPVLEIYLSFLEDLVSKVAPQSLDKSRGRDRSLEFLTSHF